MKILRGSDRAPDAPITEHEARVMTPGVGPMSQAWLRSQRRQESRIEFQGVRWTWPLTRDAEPTR